MDTMDGFIVHCDRHWIDDQVMGPISFACHDNKYSKLLETICDRIGVSKDRFWISLTSEILTLKGSCKLSIMSDSDVSCLLCHKQSSWSEITVEVVERCVPPKATENAFETPMKRSMPSACKPSCNSESLMSTPYLRSVSGSNQPFRPVDNQPTPGLIAGGVDHGTPASTTKHAKVEVDDCDSSETSDT